MIFNPLKYYEYKKIYRTIKKSELFDEKYYLFTYTDVRKANIDPIKHYIIYGAKEGRNPNNSFDTKYYLDIYKDVKKSGMNPFYHYIKFGTKESRSPNNSFDTKYNVEKSQNVKENEKFKIHKFNKTDKTNNSIVRFYNKFNTDIEKTFLAEIEEKYEQDKSRHENIKVSVIMPTYNREKTIIEAIESVLNQIHQNWELFIVDDGSTDNTKQILNNYKNDSRIHIIHGNHNGVSAARNLGLARVSGDLVAYLDSDNTWVAKYLKTMIAFITSNNLECAYAGTKIINSKGDILGYRGSKFDWEECLKSNYIDMNIFVHKVELLSTGHFDEKLKRAVDWDLILRYTKNHKTAYAPFVGCNYLDEKTENHRITDDEPIVYGDIVYLKNRFNYNYDQIAKNLKLKIAIKVPSPEDSKNEWGDYHYAVSLKKALEKLNCIVRVDNYEQWYDYTQHDDRVVIVIRGLREYTPQKGQINIIWNISHPDKIHYSEYEKFHMNYIASNSYADLLKLTLSKKTIVKPLLQATEIYYNDIQKTKNDKILFIGNSRKVYRNIVKWCIELGYDIDIYGTNWEELIPKKFIKGQYIDNSNIKDVYAKYKVVLNDHWDSMKDYGFVSNRVFDVLSCGGNLVSDYLESINYLFNHKVKMVKNKDELKLLFEEYNFGLNQKELQNTINSYHSFDNRAKEIVNDIFKFIGIGNSSRYHISDKKYKINLIINNGKNFDKVAYYRLIYPLTSVYAEGSYDVKIIENNFDNKHDFDSCDICIIQCSQINKIKNCEKIIQLKNHHLTLFILDMDLNFHEFQQLDKEKREVVWANIDHISFCSENQKKEFSLDSETTFDVTESQLDNRIWKRQYYTQKVHDNIVKYIFVGDMEPSGILQQYFYHAFQTLYKKHKNKFELIVIGNIFTELNEPWLKNIVVDSKDNYVKFIEKYLDLSKIDFALVLDEEYLSECAMDLNVMEYLNANVFPLIFTDRYKNDLLNTHQLENNYIDTLLENTIVDTEDFKIPSITNSRPQLLEVLEKVQKHIKKNDIQIKPICFYLPQFHPTVTNNKNWGEGFTEWTNVTKAKPRFDGHKQPKLPSKFGFYDLRLTQVMKQQSDFARENGIYSFCFYYYRFGEHRELDNPVNNYQKLDDVIPYCYCWANESWTRAWDGISDKHILTQKYDEITFNGIVDDLIIAMQNKNYLEHQGKPIFLIYQVNKIPDYKSWIKNLKEAIFSLTKKELIVGGVYNPDINEDMVKEIDFLVQFPPHRVTRTDKRLLIDYSLINPYDRSKEDYFESYDQVIEQTLKGHDIFAKTFLGLCPDWDNSPRRAKNAHILVGSTPEKFEYWLQESIAITKKKYTNQEIIEPFIFINAWNEWAEGAVLEPSYQEGNSYITKIKNSVLINEEK